MGKDSSGLNSNLDPVFNPSDRGWGSVQSDDHGTGSGGDTITSALQPDDRIVNTQMSGDDTGVNLSTLMEIEGDRGDAQLRSAMDTKFPT